MISLESVDPYMAGSTAGSTSDAAASGLPPSLVQPAAFPETYPTVCFCADVAPACAVLRRRRMRVRFHGIANAAIRRVFAGAGFEVTTGPRWDVLWGAPLKAEQLARLSAYQRHNHFPTTWQLGRKDHLYKCAPSTLASPFAFARQIRPVGVVHGLHTLRAACRAAHTVTGRCVAGTLQASACSKACAAQERGAHATHQGRRL